MAFSKSDKKFLKRMNGVKVSSAQFHGIIRALEKHGEDIDSFGSVSFVIRDFFSKNGHTLQEVSQLGKACVFRIEALLRLMNEPEALEQDTSHGEMHDDGCDPYLVAAAEEPLIEHGWNEFAFDRERFRARVLSIRMNQRGATVQAPS